MYLVMGCKSGEVVRLERSTPSTAARSARRLRALGWAVIVLAICELVDPS